MLGIPPQEDLVFIRGDGTLIQQQVVEGHQLEDYPCWLCGDNETIAVHRSNWRLINLVMQLINGHRVETVPPPPTWVNAA